MRVAPPLNFCLSLLFVTATLAQPAASPSAAKPARPRLVVGLVLDQMRWDYLYRYADRFSDKGGFKRMLSEGNSCEQTLIPYTPTVTACGHSAVYTGTVPAINGITGNAWWDSQLRRTVYCTEDKSASTVGSSSAQGKMSPKNMLVTSIADELRLATNFQAKVIGIAIKDRGAILPAGHSANGAYWYDNSVGNWISSSYYMPALPSWAEAFNQRKVPDSFYAAGWSLLYPAASYKASTADNKSYENKVFGEGFPYDLKKYMGKDYGKINTTSMGNEMTLAFATTALLAESLGRDDITDLLAISFSSPDYIGHSFGPNSVEAEDAMLRMDLALGQFFDLLDRTVGKGLYTAFLTADHGAAHIPEFSKENKLPGGRVFMGKIIDRLNAGLEKNYRIKKLIVSDDNYQLHLDHPLLDSAGIDADEVIGWLQKELLKEPGIDRAFSIKDLNTVPLPATLRKMLNNGYHPNRSGDLQVILLPGYIDAYGTTGTTHGLWNPYDSHIPLLWYGWGIKKGITQREVYMTDIAPTLAALLRIQMPSGNIGTVITEVLK
ncbi:MAG: alkaline phosphatase family protein [Sphingomonadales bacterium]|nr:alkaline phosphatase family protein [Sphingomonadales bacterium]